MVIKRTFKANVVVVPAAWRTIAMQRKTLAVWPRWTDPPVLPSRRVGDNKDDLRTVAAETIELFLPLADEAGIGLEGVNLRLTAWPFRKHYDVTATLEVSGGRSFVTIGRVDAWPPDPHLNVRARGYPGCGHLPLEINGHHVHRFKDNAKLGRAASLAAPVTSRLQSFRDFLRVVGEEFNIDGLDQLNPPDWTVMI